jgi:hypothetical protein
VVAPAAFRVVNPAPNPLNLHVSASLISETIGALGKSPTGEWSWLKFPDKPVKWHGLLHFA